MATIYDAWVSPKGKFGQGLAFDKTSDDGRMKIEPNGISLNETGWTLSVWVKNLIPPKENAQSTLFRGQDRQNDFEFDHYLTLHQSDLQIGFIDGDEPVEKQRLWTYSATFQLDVESLGGFREGARTKYFVNGYLSDKPTFVTKAIFITLEIQAEMNYLLNIDDFENLRNSLSHAEIGSIYGGGYGDMFTSIKLKKIQPLAKVRESLIYLWAKMLNIAVNDLNTSWMVLPYGNISDINASESNSSYRIAINTDASKTMHTLEVPELPTI